ncbi:hypothetical protein ABPG74_016828 [Tetrahymena malaccensis]
MNTRIQVGIRLRPFLDTEIGKGYQNSKIKVDKSQGKISVFDNHSNNNRVFEFDHIFDQQTSQNQVYEECKVTEMVARVLDGFHSTIFAYGQTGSGKTYTMEGKHESGNYVSDEMKGIVARAFDDLFTMIPKLKSQTKKDYNVTCSFLQIYNEKIYDLLSHHSQFAKNSDVNNIVNQQGGTAAAAAAGIAPQGLKLRWNAREQFQVENLFVFDIKNPKEAQNYFLQGVKNRITAQHKLNMTSSRSHTIFTITVQTYSEQGAHETTSKLQLVDLAGSERISLTGTEGKMAKESIDINKSLFTLRQVITALSEINQNTNNNNAFNSTQPIGQTTQGQMQSTQLQQTQQLDQNTKIQHIPYRDSKLTSLLKQSIGGNCYCLMMACIVPNDAFSDENISTLFYASKATYIKNQPVKNEDPNKLILAEVNKQNINLRSELEKANSHIAFLTAALEKSEKNNAILKQRNADLLKQLEDKPGSANQPKKDSEIKDLNQTATSFQVGGGLSEQFVKEQIHFQQQQEQFKQQQQAQIQQQKQFEQQMMMKFSQNVQKQNDLDPSGASTAFNSAHNYESIRQSIPFSNTQYQKQQTGVGFVRHSADTPTNSNANKINTNITNQQQAQISNENKLYYTQMDYDNFSDRLIESINLSRQLLESNKELRQQTDEFKQKALTCEKELTDLITENQELREQIDQLMSQKGSKVTRNNSSSKENRRNLTRRNTANDEEKDYNQDVSENDQVQQSIQQQNQDSEKFQKHAVGGSIPPRYPKKKKTDNNQYTDDQDIQDIQELVHEENLDTQQADMSISSLKRNVNKIQTQQSQRGKSSNNNSDVQNNNSYHNQTKNELIQEILELRHNQLVLEKKIKSYDADRNQIKSSSGQATIPAGNNNVANSGISSNSAGKNQQQTTPNSKQNYVFYSSNKKRGASQHQQSLPKSNNKSLSMQLQDEFAPSQTLHSTPMTATSSMSGTKGVNYLNRTQQEFNISNPNQPSSTTAAQNTQHSSLDVNNAALYTNKQGMDSIPTNFGRYTYYQQNFHNLDKLQQQQMVKFQQSQNQANQQENYKFLSTGRNTLSNISSQYQDFTNESPITHSNEQGQKRVPSQGAPSVKSKRSNSLTKNQINLLNINNNNNQTNNNNISYNNQKGAYDFYQGNVGKEQIILGNPNTGITYTKIKNQYPNSGNSNNSNPAVILNSSSNDENQNKLKNAQLTQDQNKLKGKSGTSTKINAVNN